MDRALRSLARHRALRRGPAAHRAGDGGFGAHDHELRQVYLVEVAPVVSPNLLVVAGVWAGFDEAWLCERIVSNLRDRPRRTRFRAWFPPTCRAMLYATEEHWPTLVEHVRRFREESEASEDDG